MKNPHSAIVVLILATRLNKRFDKKGFIRLALGILHWKYNRKYSNEGRGEQLEVHCCFVLLLLFPPHHLIVSDDVTKKNEMK